LFFGGSDEIKNSLLERKKVLDRQTAGTSGNNDSGEDIKRALREHERCLYVDGF
jgi:hypothetical protein